MILTIHQTAYMPWLGLIHKIAISDVYVYLDTVQFEKNSNTNRNKIKTPQGSMWVTVPILLGGHTQKTIKETEIDNTQAWRRKHWNALYMNYHKAPFFHHYRDFLEDVYKQEWKHISDLNEYMLKWTLKELGITTDFHKASDFNFEGHKSDLVLDICKKMKADYYVSGAFGKDYLDQEQFARENIKLFFQEYHHPVYPQLYGNFLPYMSVLDLMFNFGGDSLSVIMSGNSNNNDLKKP